MALVFYHIHYPYHSLLCCRNWWMWLLLLLLWRLWLLWLLGSTGRGTLRVGCVLLTRSPFSPGHSRDPGLHWDCVTNTATGLLATHAICLTGLTMRFSCFPVFFFFNLLVILHAKKQCLLHCQKMFCAKTKTIDVTEPAHEIMVFIIQASAQSHQSLHCWHTLSMEVDEGSTKNQTPWSTGWLCMRV